MAAITQVRILVRTFAISRCLARFPLLALPRPKMIMSVLYAGTHVAKVRDINCEASYGNMWCCRVHMHRRGFNKSARGVGFVVCSGRSAYMASIAFSNVIKFTLAGIWPRGVTVSTLDSESSDRGPNPREAFL